MYVDDEYRKGVDRMLADTHMALAGVKAAGFGPAPCPPIGYGDDSQPFQVALWGPAKRRIQRSTEGTPIQQRIDRTIGQMTGGTFSTQEVRQLEDRALDEAGLGDVGALTGIQEGPPVYLSPQQKQVIDHLIDAIGSDELGRRAREQYQRAFRAGHIRVR